jgi:hypothetical protein
MPLDLLLISASLALLALTYVSVALYIRLGQSLDVLDLVAVELAPVIGDLRVAGHNLAAASEALRSGVQSVKRLTEVLGHAGDDLELGRLAVRGGAKFLASLAGPLRALFKRDES